MSMPENNYDFYFDDYCCFTFNNLYSSQFNLYIQNDIDDLKMLVNDGAKIDFVSPKFSNGQYVLGVTRPQRKFPFKLVGHSLTRAQIAQITKWLQVGNIGALSFDFSPDWCYDVIVSSLGDINLYPQDEGEELFIVSFSIEWVTTTTTAARSKQPVMGYYGTHTNIDGKEIDKTEYNKQAAVANSLGIPAFTIRENGDTTTVRVHHLGDKNTTFKIEHSYLPQEDELLSKVYIAIANDEKLSPWRTTFDATISENTKGGEHIVSYSSDSNLFFADGQLPQKLDLQGHYSEGRLSIEYMHQPLVLSSPGTPIRITKEDFNFLPYVPYPYFVCAILSIATDDEENDDYVQTEYATDQNEDATQLENVDGIYSGSGFKYAIKYDTDSASLPTEFLNNSSTQYYLGCYNTIVITDQSKYTNENNYYSGVIFLTPHTEVI